MLNRHNAPASEDPLLRSARREAIVSLALAALALAYTIGYAALFGYGRTGDSLTFVFGIPDWVFWGIVIPWLACLGASWWFSFWFVEDDTLEHAEAAPLDGPALFDGDGGATHDPTAVRERRESP
jgi:hypothetical protein